MIRASHRQAARRTAALIWALMGVAAWVLFPAPARQPRQNTLDRLSALRPAGHPQLVSVQPLPEPPAEGEICPWDRGAGRETPLVLAARLEQETGVAGTTSAADLARPVTLERPPRRVIRDQFPTYSAVAVDPGNNEIVLQDENLFQILVYDRTANTLPTAALTEPKRVIGGKEAKIEFNCGLYVDPKSGDIYSINNDTLNTMVVFSRRARGNVPPDRELQTPHGSYGIAVDEEAQELYLTVEHDSAVVVYRKLAAGAEKPLRTLEGPHTALADPHGIAIDTKNGWMFVANHGNAKRKGVSGSGTFLPPSVTVYPLHSSGDTAPRA